MIPLRLSAISSFLGLFFTVGIFAQKPVIDLYYSGNFKAVIDSASLAIEAGDTAFNTFYLKAMSEVQLGRTEMAIQTLEKALITFPEQPRIKRMLAGQYFDAGDYVKARKLYDVMVQSDTSDVASLLKLAEIASFMQHYRAADSSLQKILVLDSTNLAALMMAGEILTRQNDARAVYFYERAYAIYPDNQKVAYALGNWYSQSETPDAAVPVCKRILELDSTSIRFQKLLGFSFYKMGAPDSAVNHFSRATLLGDSSVFTFKFLGISSYINVDFSRAIESLQIAAALDSMDAEIHFFLGASLGTSTLKEEAMIHLEKALELMKPDPAVTARIYSEEANIMRLEMKHEKAYELYSLAWKADTTNPLYIYFMASILDNSMHLSKEALLDYHRFIEELDKLPPEAKKNNQMPAIRKIVEDRIELLKEELFFLDEKQGGPE